MSISDSTDDYLNIATPENVAFGYTVAGIGSRFLAALVDTVLITLFQILLGLIFWLVIDLFGLGNLDTPLLMWLAALLGLLAFALLWGYYILFEMILNGQTPGKRLLHLRVIRTDGTPITLTESLVRNLVRLVDFLPMYYGVGVVTMFINSQWRRLGDLAAGTLVVYDRAPVTLDSLAVAPKLPLLPVLSANSAATDLPVDRLTPADLALVENYFQRRGEMVNRGGLARHIADTLCHKMGLPSSWQSDPQAEAFLGEILRASRQQPD